MRFSRPAMIGVAVVAFGLAVFWMLPPTTPIGGARIAPGTHYDPPPTVRPDRPAGVNRARIALEPIGSAEDSAPPPRPSASPSGSEEDAGEDAGDGDRGDAVAGAPQDDYRAGYRWAARRGVQDPRECRVWEDGASAEGCLAFAREAEDRAERSRPDEGYGPPF